jgi:predicted MFS family arabinose efflux permease
MAQPGHTAWARRVSAMAVIAATGVAVIYIPQPIQTLVALEFGVNASAAAAATVAVQAGYALGVVLLVSLGDRFSARSQVTVQLVATSFALAAAAASPAFTVFVVLCFVAGATATVGQLLVSAALRLTPPEARARTTAVLVGSFLVGLFVVRTSLGMVAGLIGWRGALVACALLVLAIVPLSLRFSPAERPVEPPSYASILGSIPRIVAASPTLRLMTAVHVLCFASFISLWSMTTVYAVTELGLTVTPASLVGLAGLLGGVATIAAAPLHARVGTRRSLTICIAAALVGALLVATLPTVLAVVLLALFLVSAGVSGEQVSTQAVALASVDPSENGRANTVYMAATFLGGSLATALGAQLFLLAGYAAVGIMGAVLLVSAASLAIVANRRGMLSPAR